MPNPDSPDAERPLTGEGRDKLRRVLKRARTADLDPSLILSSPYRRAVETAAVAAEVLAYKGEIVRTRALVPEASLSTRGKKSATARMSAPSCWPATNR